MMAGKQTRFSALGSKNCETVKFGPLGRTIVPYSSPMLLFRQLVGLKYDRQSNPKSRFGNLDSFWGDGRAVRSEKTELVEYKRMM